ncbi:MAG: hypothetical protein HYT08_03255 [Candidatus Levybacteria bacterium]|nr:hypothetical protein [Candidatus Levybacteria bacterium]
MKEFEVKAQFNGLSPIKSELTLQSNPSTLEVRGNIFMPEPGNGEIPQTPQGEIPTKGAELPQIEKIRQEWEEFNKGKTLSDEEIGRQKGMIALGIHPQAGASDTEPPASNEQEPTVKTGGATWKMKDEDRPIVVTGYKGKGPDGRDYVSIEGSETGIPLDEIEYPKESQETEGEVTNDQPTVENNQESRGQDLTEASRGGQPPEEPPETATPAEPEGDGNGEGDHTRDEPQAQRSIFDNLPGLGEMSEEEKQRLRAVGWTEDEIREIGEQRKALERLVGKYRRAEKAGLINYEEAFNTLNAEMVHDDEVSQNYLNNLVEGAREWAQKEAMRRMPDLIAKTIEIEQTTERGSWERAQELKKMIATLSPDDAIPTQVAKIIAEDDEASEIYLDKIISKPFGAPEDHYELSFYANINLASFLTEVSNIDRARLLDYVRKKEASVRFHEMNRTIISESGNIDAFLGISRSVTPYHLQTATQIEGVEFFRQLLDLAYGRLYAKTNRVTEQNFQTEVLDWAIKRFYEEAGYRWNEEGKRWEYQAGGSIKSKFKNADGSSKPIEEWEIQRAMAFGRNIHSAFYRHSELISWSNIPQAWEDWLKSLPSETVVRAFAGLKYLSHRFRIGATSGGPWFVRLLYDKIQKAGYKEGLKKIGTLDIKEDLLPTGFFKGGGFDKGWRTFTSYLDTDVARIEIPPIEAFPESVREGVQKFIDSNGGNRTTTLYNFLTGQELFAQVLYSQGFKINGVELPGELRNFSHKQQSKYVESILEPIMDQINLSLGVMTSFGAITPRIKELLWEKAADSLPLRVSYFLAEEGVKNLPGYDQVRGEGANLFNDELETRLIKAQHLRIEEQKKTNQRVELSRFFNDAGLTDPEKVFIERLQEFGRNNASKLANVSFPHVPFLDDVPFKEANYVGLGAEVFPRRVGGDFRAYSETNNAFNAIIGNLTQPYEKISENMRQLVDSLSSPEGSAPAQDVALPILKTYFEMARQWSWTKLPLLKMIREFQGVPTSWFQNFISRSSPSWDASQMNLHANEALSLGIIRREKLPGDEKSQMDDLLQSTGSTWFHVLREQSPRVIMFFLFAMIMEFFKQVREGK